MSKVALIAEVGPTDHGIDLDKLLYKEILTVSFSKYNNKKDVSIHNFLDEIKKLRIKPSEVAMDLLIVAATMYAADTRFLRNKYGDDGWTRMIDLYIPVSDIAIWQKHQENLNKIFRFLTGDIWNVIFRERNDKALLLSPDGRLSRYKMPYNTDTVCLFSGGMDSFIGAIDLLNKGTMPLLLGHSKSADVSTYQQKCHEALSKEFNKNILVRINAYISIPKISKKDVENSERGRSFMFLSLGAICATTLAVKSKLYIPENGLITLNIPLTPLRIGSHSTRTTHPHYFALMKELLIGLGMDVELVNPYQFKTKGEMLSECTRPGLVMQTENMSCSHPSARWFGMGNIHCGYCVPCINRQAAVLKAGLKDSNKYRENILKNGGLKINKVEGADVLAFKYMITKVNTSPNYLLAAIRNTGPLGPVVDQYVDVYRRGLEEVDELIKNVKLV